MNPDGRNIRNSKNLVREWHSGGFQGYIAHGQRFMSPRHDEPDAILVQFFVGAITALESSATNVAMKTVGVGNVWISLLGPA